MKFKTSEPKKVKSKHCRFNEIVKMEGAPKDNPDLCEW